MSRAVGTSQNAPPERTILGTRGIWTSLLAQKEKRDSLALTRTLTSHEAALALQSPKGLMLHGEVGTGKSMLIDLFADCLPNRKKRRWHFNTFILEIISRLEQLRLSRIGAPSGQSDEYSLLWLARDLIEKSPILFLDEFQLPDRVASKILSNLMTSFFQLGGVLIATSNRMPEELAKAAGMEFDRPVSKLSRLGWRLGMQGTVGRDDGPGQKGEFAQFLEVLRTRCEVWEMEGKKDYRRMSGADGSSIKHTNTAEAIFPSTTGQVAVQQSLAANIENAPTPSDSETTIPKHYLIKPSPTATEDEFDTYRQSILASVQVLTSKPPSEPVHWTSLALKVYNRALIIPKQYNGIALFTFDEICGAILGPADYITLCSTYHSIIILDVPILGFLQKNEARRFITLLDAMYEARCRLLITAAAAPDDLMFPSAPTAQNADGEELIDDAVYPETYSEIHQDLTSPFRPNVSSYTTGDALPMDSLEDDPPNRLRRPGSSYTDERRGDAGKAPDFASIRGLTGEDEQFAVKRAESRIWEMCSAKWWDMHASDSFWRPLPAESRHWERARRPATTPVIVDGRMQSTEPATEGKAETSKDDVQEGIFKHGASPFRVVDNAPPKIAWTHVWGTIKWGKGAGAWGKGVEGLSERKREEDPDVDHVTPSEGRKKR